MAGEIATFKIVLSDDSPFNLTTKTDPEGNTSDTDLFDGDDDILSSMDMPNNTAAATTVNLNSEGSHEHNKTADEMPAQTPAITGTTEGTTDHHEALHGLHLHIADQASCSKSVHKIP